MSVRTNKTKSRNQQRLATKSCCIAVQALEGREQSLQFTTCNSLRLPSLIILNKLVISRRYQDFQCLEWCADLENKDFAWCKQLASTSSFMSSLTRGSKTRVLVNIAVELQLEDVSISH